MSLSGDFYSYYESEISGSKAPVSSQSGHHSEPKQLVNFVSDKFQCSNEKELLKPGLTGAKK